MPHPFRVLPAALTMLLSGGAAGAAELMVTSGESFFLNGETIRIVNIAAPETIDPRCVAEAVDGAKATERLASLLAPAVIAGRGLRIERHGVDVYGRTLARIYLHDRDVGETLLAAGLARPWRPGERPPDWCPGQAGR